MIRYVVAMILAVALLVVGFAGVEYAAGLNGERQVAASAADLDDAAVSLIQNDELPPRGHQGPRRFVRVEFPDDSMTTEPVVHFEWSRVEDEPLSVVEYRVEGGPVETEPIEAPITNVTGGDVVALEGTEDRDLRLTLIRDEEDRAVVQVVRMAELDEA